MRGAQALVDLQADQVLGITLEEMDALFARSVRKTIWAQLRGKELPPMDEDVMMTSDDPKKRSTIRIEKVDL